VAGPCVRGTGVIGWVMGFVPENDPINGVFVDVGHAHTQVRGLLWYIGGEARCVFGSDADAAPCFQGCRMVVGVVGIGVAGVLVDGWAIADSIERV
jgi:hypothetical protein